MKRAFTVSMVLLALGLSGHVAAQTGTTTTTTLQLSGVVSARCGLTVQATPAASMLNLSEGETGMVVGQVTESCNSPAGYSVVLTSQNNGELRATAAGATPLAYSIRYDTVSGPLTQALEAPRQPTGGVQRVADMAINIPANARAIPGTYSDIITLSIRVN